ncbi:hypothetical protein [Nocardioides antri]|uniref:DUF4367 domain-containing protein n=1 Tax=Nocardioides antri TaxID=2607659 RepID=A0A5B1LY62_9ACTN|nr:hypothetical protein [Nocardioides antri]KAA1425622.1 hypothetical protein F0U47_17690 [Nocardioides antri]
MIEHELAALADRVAPAVPADLPDRVLARLDEPRPRNRGRIVAAAAAAVAACSLLVPQVRAVAVDLLGVAGIEISQETPDAPPEPRAPIPDPRPGSVADARAAVDFPVAVPRRLGPPDEVVVSDGDRLVTMTWHDAGVELTQFEGRLGPVFSKDVGDTAVEPVRVRGVQAWWIGAPHDVTYVDREGAEVTATERLSGRTLVWDAGSGVTFRLEGGRLDVAEAVAIGRSVR